MWPYIISGALIGMTGSLHCVGMCGPLALAIPTGDKGIKSIFLNAIQYNLGRSVTYAFLGMMFGLLGNGFFVAGYQQWVSITGGILILLIWLMNYTNLLKIDLLNRLTQRVQVTLNRFINRPFRPLSSGIIGILNGFLPCGLVYVAIGAAMATGHPWTGTVLMFSFGLGTIPLMLGLMVFGKRIRFAQRARLSRIVPGFILFVSLILILRGMSLGIPFISPDINVEGTTPIMIHCEG